MRRAPAVTILLVACAAAAAAADLASDLAAVGAFSPRTEGSAAESALLAWIDARVAATGAAPVAFDFEQSTAEYSRSSCRSVRIEGRRPDTLVVVAPVNHPESAAAGAQGDVNVALALELIRRAREAPPPVSLEVLFLGAEYGDGPGYPLGSALWLRERSPATPAAVVYLSLATGAGPVRVLASGRGVGAPGWLVAAAADALVAAGVPYRIDAAGLVVDRLGLGDRATVIEPWLRAGLPAVALEDADGTTASATDDTRTAAAATAAAATDAAEVAEALDRLLAAGGDGWDREWDNHHLPLALGGRTIVLGEGTWVALVTGALALLLLVSLAFPRGLKKYLGALARGGWVLVPLLAVAAAALLAATLGLERLLDLRGFPSLWRWRPAAFLGAKLAVAAALAAAVLVPLTRLRAARKASFHSAASLLLLLVDVLVVAWIDVSLAAPFVWAFAWVFLASRARRRLTKLLLFLPSAVPIAAGFVAALAAPSLPLARFLLFSRWWGNLLLAVLALPFLLFLLRLALALGLRGRAPLRRALGAAAIVLPAAAALGLGAWTALWSPFSPGSPRPVTAEQSIGPGGANLLRLDSPVPLGTVIVDDGGVGRTFAVAAREAQFELAASRVAVGVSSRSVASLGRVNVSLAITAPAPVRALRAVLRGPPGFVLYDCTFPFVLEDDGGYRLLAGAFPAVPLALELTLPEGGAYRLELEMDLAGPLLDARVEVPSATVDERVRIRADVDITT